MSDTPDDIDRQKNRPSVVGGNGPSGRKGPKDQPGQYKKERKHTSGCEAYHHTEVEESPKKETREVHAVFCFKHTAICIYFTHPWRMHYTMSLGPYSPLSYRRSWRA